MSLTRQIIFLLPLLVILPIIFIKIDLEGVEGIMFSAPIADFVAAVISLIVINGVFKNFEKKLGR